MCGSWPLFRGTVIIMNNKITTRERSYLATIKNLPCMVCDHPPPSDAHHILQHMNWLCVPLCRDCHQGRLNGIHGEKRIWKVMKKTEMSVLNDTIQAVMGEMG